MKTTLKKTLKGERITLKRSKPSIALATKIFETVDRNREHLFPWLDRVEGTKAIEDSLKFLFDAQEKSKLEEGYKYSIFFGKQYLGQIGYLDVSKKNKSCEIGYRLDEKYTKNGYITEAVKVLETALFKKGFNRIQIKCDKRNIASAGVAKKCGYILEGTLKEHIYSKYYDDMRNTLIFSKLKSDYLAEK